METRNFGSIYRNLHPRQLTRLLTSSLRNHTKKEMNSNSDYIHPEEAKTGFAEHRNRKGEIFSALSKAVDFTLSTHQDVTSFTPVPYLSEAAELALEIWNTVQNNRNAISSLPGLLILAEDAVRLVLTIWTTCDQVSLETVRGEYGVGNNDTMAPRPLGRGMSGDINTDGEERAEQKIENLIPHLETHSSELYCTLNEILVFATRNASQNVVSTSDARKVLAQYQSKIEHVSFWFTTEVNQRIISRVNLAQQRATQMESAPVYSSAPVPPTTDFLSAEVTASSTSLFLRKIEARPTPPVPRGSSPTTLREFPAGAASFPATFNCAGATFQTGNTSFSARNIRFTSISGDQNISCVNDQSRRWNFGNVYELDPSGGQPSALRPDANGKYHGGRGLSRSEIAALGKEAFGFGRDQTQIPSGHHPTLQPGDGGMREQLLPVRSRRENYRDPQGIRNGYYDDVLIQSHERFV